MILPSTIATRLGYKFGNLDLKTGARSGLSVRSVNSGCTGKFHSSVV